MRSPRPREVRRGTRRVLKSAGEAVKRRVDTVAGRASGEVGVEIDAPTATEVERPAGTYPVLQDPC